MFQDWIIPGEPKQRQPGYESIVYIQAESFWLGRNGTLGGLVWPPTRNLEAINRMSVSEKESAGMYSAAQNVAVATDAVSNPNVRCVYLGGQTDLAFGSPTHSSK